MKITRFVVLVSAIALAGCGKPNTDWHLGLPDSVRFSTPVESGLSYAVKCENHRWRIIGQRDKKNDTYDWGWEVALVAEPDPKSSGQQPVIFVDEIRYTILDKDGFELATDTLEGSSMTYGGNLTYRHSSRLKGFDDGRAADSRVVVFLAKDPNPKYWKIEK